MPWISWLFWIGIIYLALCLIFYFFQDYFFFRPEILPRQFEYRYPFPFEEVHFDMEDGGTINGIHFKVPNAKGVVYYLKGNSKSIKGWGKFARDFVSKGYDFFMIDYRGFGKSEGRRTESTLFNDAQTVYKWLYSKYREDQIVVYGRSLGSGIAARIAAWNDPKMLLLDSPYYSFWYHIKRYGFLLPCVGCCATRSAPISSSGRSPAPFSSCTAIAIASSPSAKAKCCATSNPNR